MFTNWECLQQVSVIDLSQLSHFSLDFLLSSRTQFLQLVHLIQPYFWLELCKESDQRVRVWLEWECWRKDFRMTEKEVSYRAFGLIALLHYLLSMLSRNYQQYLLYCLRSLHLTISLLVILNYFLIAPFKSSFLSTSYTPLVCVTILY